ncbi:hypothetical protein [Nesterenkonia alkaliphila]|uniref:Uncharacterized protein n=1 Tax=Nesterenkonia alkaliphila TaxID=1463631 RepID=A0A7K1UIJ8_9MICC|nr:hypothetical protein [Nesterenkonia alkaliphila]MVT26305.1 hypothetical protein [Nesterenkonia alkaliphila]GFZ99163.1 hypothetical protein GCM10011359_30210 [Nesterenkonia alkaliphila]
MTWFVLIGLGFSVFLVLARSGRPAQRSPGPPREIPFEFSLVHRGQPRKLTAVADVDISPR